MLDFLDYPRQSVWNVGRGLSDMLQGNAPNLHDVAPGALGALLGVGLGATGIGLPLAMLAGTGMSTLAQGAVGREAMKPDDALRGVGIDPESGHGVLSSILLGAATDPLSYLGGIGAAKGVQHIGDRAFARGLGDEIPRIAKDVDIGTSMRWPWLDRPENAHNLPEMTPNGLRHIPVQNAWEGPGAQAPSIFPHSTDPAGNFNELDPFTRGVPLDARAEWPPMMHPDLHHVDLGVWDQKLKQLQALPDDMPLHPELTQALQGRLATNNDNASLAKLLEDGQPAGYGLGGMPESQANQISEILHHRGALPPDNQELSRVFEHANQGRATPEGLAQMQKLLEEREWGLPAEMKGSYHDPFAGAVEKEVQRRALPHYVSAVEDYPLLRGVPGFEPGQEPHTLADMLLDRQWSREHELADMGHTAELPPLVHVPGHDIVKELSKRMAEAKEEALAHNFSAAHPNMPMHLHEEPLVHDLDPETLRRIIENFEREHGSGF